MNAIHCITSSNKMNGQNCRLKSNLANFQIKGIEFNPNTDHAFRHLPMMVSEQQALPSGKQALKFVSTTSLMSHRIRGLSFQSTT